MSPARDPSRCPFCGWPVRTGPGTLTFNGFGLCRVHQDEIRAAYETGGSMRAWSDRLEELQRQWNAEKASSSGAAVP